MELPSHTVLSRPGHLLVQWGNLQIGENFRRKIFWLNNCLLEYATHPKWLVKFTLNYHAQQFFYICLLSGRSQYSNMNSDNYFYFVSFICYCYQWPLLLFLHRHEPSMYTRTQYFPNQFPGMIKPSSGRVSPPSAHHGMFDCSSQEIWRSETFIQVNYAYIGLPDVHLLFQTRSAWCIFSVVVVTIS